MKNFKFYYEKQELIEFIDEIISHEKFKNIIYDESAIKNFVNAIQSQMNTIKQKSNQIKGNIKKSMKNLRSAWESGNREKFFIKTLLKYQQIYDIGSYEEFESDQLEELAEFFDENLANIFIKNYQGLIKDYNKEFISAYNSSGEISQKMRSTEAMNKTITKFVRNSGLPKDDIANNRFILTAIADIINQSNTKIDVDPKEIANQFKQNIEQSSQEDEENQEDDTETDLNMMATKTDFKNSVVEFLKSPIANNPKINGQFKRFLILSREIMKKSKTPEEATMALREVLKYMEKLKKRKFGGTKLTSQ